MKDTRPSKYEHLLAHALVEAGGYLQPAAARERIADWQRGGEPDPLLRRAIENRHRHRTKSAYELAKNIVRTEATATPRSRVSLVTTELSDYVREPISTVRGPADAAGMLQDLIGHKDREHFVTLHLDVRNQVTAVETVSVGTLAASLVHPREVYKAAILNNAASIIAGHNHPSGNCDPSREDYAIYQRLSAAGRVIGVDLLDFLVVSRERFYSVRDE